MDGFGINTYCQDHTYHSGQHRTRKKVSCRCRTHNMCSHIGLVHFLLLLLTVQILTSQAKMTSNHFWMIALLSRPSKQPWLKRWGKQQLFSVFLLPFSFDSGSSFLCKLELCVVYRQNMWPDSQGLEKSPVSSEIAQHRPSMLQRHCHNFTFRKHHCN